MMENNPPKYPSLTNTYIGISFISFSLLNIFINSFFNIEILNFLPKIINFFTTFVIGFLGLFLIRSEKSDINFIHLININTNNNNFNGFLTLCILFLILSATPAILNWFIIEANFSGNTKDACTGDGACWTYVKVWIKRFAYGMYPNEEHWRINVSFILVITLGLLGNFARGSLRKYITLYYVLIYPIIAFLVIYYLISGGSFNLVWVETGAWGGLSLTFIVSFFCLIFCFPVGMLLALGRRSILPVLKFFSIGFIEFWRGVPLITVLFMSAVMFPLFLPEGVFVDKLVMVIIAISLFEAAYVAEVIRGGLQALPRGQYDAAKSLGMGYWTMHIFVILPQALKLVIPGIANTFLALVKDTPLIFVVGLLEIVGMLNMAKTNPKWLGFAMEGYIFAGIIFWIICYSMSKYSQKLELKYKTDR
jgi:general L-amino acid transport system permease protein